MRNYEGERRGALGDDEMSTTFRCDLVKLLCPPRELDWGTTECVAPYRCIYHKEVPLVPNDLFISLNAP